MTESDPNKAGTSTSEFKLATIVGVIGAVVAGASLALTQLKEVLPDAGWIAVGLTVLGGLGTMLAVASKYIGGRSAVKVAQLGVQAASIEAGVPQVVTIPPSPPTISATRPSMPSEG